MAAAIFIVIVALAYFAAPKVTLVAVLVAFLFLELAVALVGGKGSASGAMMMQFDEGALVGLVVAVLVVAVLRRRPLRFSPWWRWWTMYVAAGLISIGLQHSGWARGILGLFLVGKGFVYAFAIEQQDWQRSDLQLWRRALVGALGLVLACALPDLFAPAAFRSLVGFPPEVEFRSGLPSIVSLLGHPGGYGFAMGVGALICLAQLLAARERKWAVSALLFFLGALLSLRRKVILGPIAAAVFVMAVLAKRVDRRLVVGTVVVLVTVLLPIGAIVMPILVEGAKGYFSADALTYQARTALYGGSLLLAKQYFPFGAGVGRYGSAGSVTTYSDIYYEFGFNMIYGMSPTFTEFITDTFWPQVLGETGVIGLIGYGGAVASLMRGAMVKARLESDTSLLPLRLAAPMVAVDMLLESAAGPTFGVAFPASLTCGLLALSSMSWHAQLPQESIPDSTGSSHHD